MVSVVRSFSFHDSYVYFILHPAFTTSRTPASVRPLIVFIRSFILSIRSLIRSSVCSFIRSFIRWGFNFLLSRHCSSARCSSVFLSSVLFFDTRISVRCNCLFFAFFFFPFSFLFNINVYQSRRFNVELHIYPMFFSKNFVIIVGDMWFWIRIFTSSS